METRSQTRQQEVEGQLSKLLVIMTTVQEQQARQEQLSKDHKADLEKVTSIQQEQAERQEDLARCQETKWLQFMETQDKRCLEIEHKQLEAETTMQALQRDVSSMKSVLQGRISSTEKGLEGLQSTQKKLTSLSCMPPRRLSCIS